MEQKEEEGLGSEPSPVVQTSQPKVKLMNTEFNFYGGKIAEYYEAWEKLTSDKWILNLVQGFEIDFVQNPVQRWCPPPLRLSRADTQALNTAVKQFHEQGIIERCPRAEAEYVSTIFPVMKKDGWRELF